MADVPYGYEVFHSKDYEFPDDLEVEGSLEPGWYWWSCFPGCIPDGDPVGPFGSEDEAVADLLEGVDDDDTEGEDEDYTEALDDAAEAAWRDGDDECDA